MYAVLLFLIVAADPLPKAAAPSAKAQAKALKSIKEVYGDELATAKNLYQKKVLIQKLLKRCTETSDDKDAQFALLHFAKDVALQSGDVPKTFEILNGIDVRYQFDLLHAQIETVLKMCPLLTTAEQHKAMARAALDVSGAAVTHGDFSAARQMSVMALNEAKKSNDAALIKLTNERKFKVDELQKAFEKAATALDVLNKSPKDAAANLTVGKYYCFAEGNWKRGLPLLVLSEDPVLKPLAEADLHGSENPSEQVKIGDGWWDIDQKQRASHWYQIALPRLTGVPKDRAEKRLKEAPPKTPELTVVAVCEHHWGTKGESDRHHLLSNGHIDSAASQATWERKDQKLIFHWVSGAIDTVQLSPDRSSYEGKNQDGLRIWRGKIYFTGD